MLSYVNKRWSERESWLRNTETEQEKGETESTKITRRRSSSAPRLTTALWGPPLRRKSHKVNPPCCTANYACALLLLLLCIGFSVSSDKSAAEKRRQLIQESKFLGGDMEHTHLVKGLDFALLQKVGQ